MLLTCCSCTARQLLRPASHTPAALCLPRLPAQVISVQHTIDRREVEAKKALPKDESPVRKEEQAASGGHRTKKVFVGGLAATVDEDTFRAYFEEFGLVDDAVVMFDHENKRPRGFGFITFAGEGWGPVQSVARARSGAEGWGRV